MGETATVRVEGRLLRLSNLDKVLYRESGFTKAEVIDYYSRVAPVLLPRLAGRPATLRRYPGGVDGPSFLEGNVPRHAPEWVRTVRVGTSGGGFADFVVVQDLATLVWVANLAVVELRVPQWSVGPRGGRRSPDLVVFDLEPGLPATVVECCRVAELVRVELERDGLVVFAKTSGVRGVQLCAAVEVSSAERVSVYAREVAVRVAAEHPELVVARVGRSGQVTQEAQTAREARAGKVVVDWAQNDPRRATVVAYSLRARGVPSVSTPVSWEEVGACERPEDLVFTAEDVVGRVTHGGDLFGDVGVGAVRLPG